jgi:hypothetical protein
MPSPLKSPTATDSGFEPTLKSLCDVKLNVAEAPAGRSATSKVAAAPIRTRRRRLPHARTAAEITFQAAFISKSS